MVPNVPLSSAPGREYRPPILGMLGAHGGQFKREISFILILCAIFWLCIFSLLPNPLNFSTGWFVGQMYSILFLIEINVCIFWFYQNFPAQTSNHNENCNLVSIFWFVVKLSFSCLHFHLLLQIQVNKGQTLICTLVSTKTNWLFVLYYHLIPIFLISGWFFLVFIGWFLLPNKWRGPAQDVTFFYAGSHLSRLQSCTLIFSINFYFIYIFKCAPHDVVVEFCRALEIF